MFFQEVGAYILMRKRSKKLSSLHFAGPDLVMQGTERINRRKCHSAAQWLKYNFGGPGGHLFQLGPPLAQVRPCYCESGLSLCIVTHIPCFCVSEEFVLQFRPKIIKIILCLAPFINMHYSGNLEAMKVRVPDIFCATLT